MAKYRTALSIRAISLLQAAIFATVLYPGAWAQSTPDRAGNTSVAATSRQKAAEENPLETVQDDGSQDEDSKPPEGEANLRVRFSIPAYKSPVSTLTIYPYPTRLPKQMSGKRKIEDKPERLKSTLLQLGYSSRSSESRLFPTNGWRWQYILRAACAKSGTHPPTNIITMYPWIKKITPYVQDEIHRVNDIEAERDVRYHAAVKDFEENGLDIENEAVRKGLNPVEIPMKIHARKLLSGAAILPPGTWYIVANHKTANLKFYWQIPVTVAAGENRLVELTQTNALTIEGGW